MLKATLQKMITKHGKRETKKIINKELKNLNEQMRKASNIYTAIDIEHDILDRQSMLKWLKDV